MTFCNFLARRIFSKMIIQNQILRLQARFCPIAQVTNNQNAAISNKRCKVFRPNAEGIPTESVPKEQDAEFDTLSIEQTCLFVAVTTLLLFPFS